MTRDDILAVAGIIGADVTEKPDKITMRLGRRKAVFLRRQRPRPNEEDYEVLLAKNKRAEIWDNVSLIQWGVLYSREFLAPGLGIGCYWYVKSSPFWQFPASGTPEVQLEISVSICDATKQLFGQERWWVEDQIAPRMWYGYVKALWSDLPTATCCGVYDMFFDFLQDQYQEHFTNVMRRWAELRATMTW